MAKNIVEVWKILPEDIKNTLMVSSKGGTRLFKSLESLVATLNSSPLETSAPLIEIVKSMAFEVWENAPFSYTCCSILMQIDNFSKFLPRDLKKYITNVDRSGLQSIDVSEEYEDLLAKDPSQAEEYLLNESLKATVNFPSLALAYKHAFTENRLEWLQSLFSQNLEIPKFLKMSVLGDIFMAQGINKAAFRSYQSAIEEFKSPRLLEKAGECQKRMEHGDEALNLWTESLKLKTWDLSLARRVHDTINKLDQPKEKPQGKGLIFLYTWNHAKDLDKALESLALSDTGDCLIKILNNGSTDNTDSIISKWQQKMPEKMTRIDLPVNIGAPAARNWLLSLDKVKEADWVVYMDDDAILPKDWLGHFARAEEVFPEAGIFGCKVADLNPSYKLQLTDMHVESDLMQSKDSLTERRLNLVTSNTSFFDSGEYDYICPCTSVTGCCHMLKKANIEKIGGFNLAFSPSQFDDLDRDLRSILEGDTIVYNGHLKVLHAKVSGSDQTLMQKTNSYGNSNKLNTLYNSDVMKTIGKNSLKVLKKHSEVLLKSLAQEDLFK